MTTKGHNYFWIPERLNILREVFLIATSLEDAAVKMRDRGILCTSGSISTIANKPENRFSRPNMIQGRGRKSKNVATIFREKSRKIPTKKQIENLIELVKEAHSAKAKI
jgi:hypothetical protein